LQVIPETQSGRGDQCGGEQDKRETSQMMREVTAASIRPAAGAVSFLIPRFTANACPIGLWYSLKGFLRLPNVFHFPMQSANLLIRRLRYRTLLPMHSFEL
jgi:hypothetical protein